MQNGFPIVLTADRTLIADYRILFDGMLAASQTTTFPPALLQGLLMPTSPVRDGRAVVAPLGLRRIEAALLQGGFSADDIAVVTPESLHQAIGPATRLVGITSGEPAGAGMNSSTMTEIAGGMIYPQAMFRKLMRQVQRQIAASHSPARVILGGPGAWQLIDNDAVRREFDIDHVITGYAEGNVAGIFRSLLDNDLLPTVIHGENVPVEAIPPIRGASTMGVVEISRGCGYKCGFCTLGDIPMRHLAPETILADVRTNIANGIYDVASLSEDFFRYGGRGTTVNPPALIDLLTRLRQLPELRLMQIDHANIISIAQYSDEQLRAVHDLLVSKTNHRFPWVNLGVETVSGELLLANGGTAKMGSVAPAEWGDFCKQQIERLCRAGFFPLISLVVGLPGETEDDVRRMLAWVASLSSARLSIFPVLHAPIDGTAGVRARDLRKSHWQLFKDSYRMNFRWIPQMYWDNQTGAGISPARRMTLQVLGRGQVPMWNALFAWHSMGADR